VTLESPLVKTPISSFSERLRRETRGPKNAHATQKDLKESGWLTTAPRVFQQISHQIDRGANSGHHRNTSTLVLCK